MQRIESSGYRLRSAAPQDRKYFDSQLTYTGTFVAHSFSSSLSQLINEYPSHRLYSQRSSLRSHHQAPATQLNPQSALAY